LERYIVQKESKHNVHQWRFSQVQIIALAGSIIVLLGATTFLLSDFLSRYLYEQRLDEFRLNYEKVANNMNELNERLSIMDGKINIIEDKDRAIRSYAGMPTVDRNIMEVGIGGYATNPGNQPDNLAPAVNEELAALEMNIDKLSRQINLEMDSYSSIYKEVKENIERISKIPSIRPVPGGYLNSSFGYRIDPIDNVTRFHHGQDITVKTGTPIYAPASGVVKRAYYAGGFGNHIKLDHGNGYTTLFAHLSKIKVKHGQRVERGEIIGLTGNTGRSTAPHLHYEIHHYGEPKNPLDYFFHVVD